MKIAVLGVLKHAEMQSMIVDKIVDIQDDHIFPVLSKQVKAAIEETFATSLLQNNESILSKLINAVVKDVNETIKDRQADSDICRATIRALEYGAFVDNLAKRIKEDSNV